MILPRHPFLYTIPSGPRPITHQGWGVGPLPAEGLSAPSVGPFQGNSDVNTKIQAQFQAVKTLEIRGRKKVGPFA